MKFKLCFCNMIRIERQCLNIWDNNCYNEHLFLKSCAYLCIMIFGSICKKIILLSISLLLLLSLSIVCLVRTNYKILQQLSLKLPKLDFLAVQSLVFDDLFSILLPRLYLWLISADCDDSSMLGFSSIELK